MPKISTCLGLNTPRQAQILSCRVFASVFELKQYRSEPRRGYFTVYTPIWKVGGLSRTYISVQFQLSISNLPMRSLLYPNWRIFYQWEASFVQVASYFYKCSEKPEVLGYFYGGRTLSKCHNIQMDTETYTDNYYWCYTLFYRLQHPLGITTAKQTFGRAGNFIVTYLQFGILKQFQSFR